MTLITLVILPARDVFARLAAFDAFDESPAPIIASQIQPISGSIDNVETTSNQKKKLMKYSSFEIEARKISIVKAAKQKAVMAKHISSLSGDSEIVLISSKNKVYTVIVDMIPTTMKFSRNLSSLILQVALLYIFLGFSKSRSPSSCSFSSSFAPPFPGPSSLPAPPRGYETDLEGS
jgi:hypothetical protein